MAGQEPVDMDPVGRRQYGEAKLMRYKKSIFLRMHTCVDNIKLMNKKCTHLSYKEN